MPWFYVDDGFSDSKPVLNMPDRHRLAACGLWVLGGSWSAKEELDGFVPNSKLRQLGARPPILAALTEPGPMSAPLCEKLPTGIQFNSWGKWQKTRADLNEKRREDAERQRAWREAHPDAKPVRKVRGRNALASTDDGVSQRDTPVTNDVTNSVTAVVSDDVSQRDLARTGARPDPTRPDPTHISSYVPESASLSNAGDGIAATPGADLVREIIPNDIPAPERTMLRIKASAMLKDGAMRQDIADGLRLYLTKPHLGAGALPSLVSEVVRTRTHQAANGHDTKVNDFLAFANRPRQQEIEQ